jgi:pimeloyl-ACP methyl ester carboxylesterase
MPFLTAAGRRLEYARFDAEPGRPVLVFLHEGLGSMRQWREFPERLARVTGCAAVVYSRYGYGQSDVLVEPRRSVRFMHEEALESLPQVLAALEIESPILVGHSDGASIALIHAGAGHAVRGVVAMAPHVFVEDLGIHSIESARRQFEAGDLATRLGRYHRDPRKTFYLWNDVWLDPEFRSWRIDGYLTAIRCPVLAIQGLDDEYGSLAQLDAIERAVLGPCTRRELAGCGHSPFRERHEETVAAVRKWVATMDRGG